MGQIIQKWRVPISALLALVLIGGAYLLARGIQSPSLAEASAETALLNAIASRDSDSDGLPDWEEALYGTSPSTADTNHLGMTDGAAVAKGLIVPKAVADVAVSTSSPSSTAFIDPALPPPPPENSLTAQFSRQFLAAYLAATQAAGGVDLSQDQVNNIVIQVLGSLSDSVAPAPDFKKLSDLTVSGSGPDALKIFAASAEAVLLKNTSTAKADELIYLKYFLEHNDSRALPPIVSLAKAYRESAVGLAMLPVPKELADADLALINALMRTSEIASDFARVNTDPLATMLALYQHQQTTGALTIAFVEVGRIYNTSGVSLPVNTPGATFVNLVTNAIKSIESVGGAPMKP